MRIVQMLPTLGYGDAVGNDVLALDKVIKKEGYQTGIYAENIDKRIPSGVAHHVSKLSRLKNEDAIIYHLSVGSELNRRLIKYPGKKIIVYHNITPYSFFTGYSHALWEACRNGIKGVEYLSDKVDYCLADSEFNKQDLQKLGYKCPIDVLPILIPFDEYRKAPNNEVMERYGNDGITNILFTGRIAPNKCQEDVIAAFYKYYMHYNRNSRLILVGSYGNMGSYYVKLQEYVKQLGVEEQVIFTGHIGFDEILAYYRVADLFLCMSEHEGFCVPLVEAMFFGIPVVAYSSCAVPYTLGGSGFLLQDKNPLEAAGVINYILENNDAREMILQSQRERLKDFDHDVIEKEFLTYLKDFIEGKK